MKSRMDRYYSTDNVKERTKLNQHLYREIYEDADYTNIEGIADIEKTNEIDINKIKELLKSNLNPNPRSIVRRTNAIEENITQDDEPQEEKSYDIRDVLSKAKDERKDDKEDYRSLRNTQYDILKNLNIKSDAINEMDDVDLKGLINTITNTSMLNKLGDKELSLNMFSELQSLNNTTVEEAGAIKSIIDEETGKKTEDLREEIDKSFFTSSLNFKEKDFDELKDINVSLKKSNVLIKITITILVIAILGVIAFVVYNFIK